MNSKPYISLDKLLVYKLARELSSIGWHIYNSLDAKTKFILGDQFLTSTDSTGANIAESYGRFHYLDKVRFYYNARGSLLESRHWAELLYERKFIKQEEEIRYLNIYKDMSLGLNGLINSTMKAKKSQLLVT